MPVFPGAKPKRDTSGGDSPAQPLIQEGKYRAKIVAGEEIGGTQKKGQNAGQPWSADKLTFQFEDEGQTKTLTVFHGSKSQKELLEATGLIEDGQEDAANYAYSDLVGQTVIVYVTVSKDGKFNNAQGFSAAPAKRVKKEA